jgi:hypothetical protein
MLASIAESLGVDFSLLKITSITDARRRLLAVNVNVEATVADIGAAKSMASRTTHVAQAAQSGASSAGLNVTVQATAAVISAPVISAPTSTPFPSAPSPKPTSSPQEEKTLASNHLVIIEVRMPYSKAEFGDHQKTRYKKAVVALATNDASDIDIPLNIDILLNISETRRRAGVFEKARADLSLFSLNLCQSLALLT